MIAPFAPVSGPLLVRTFVTLLLAVAASACGPGGGDGAATWQVVFTLDETTDDLETLYLSVAYVGGNFVGAGSTVACDLLPDDDGETADFDDDDNGTLTIDIDATDQPLAEGTDLVACEFQAAQEPATDDFTVTIDDADPADPEDVTVSVDVNAVAAAGATP